MPRPTPWRFLNGSLRRSRSAHQLGHVHLVEGGQHGRGALRLDEVAGDRQAALRHAHAFFGCGCRARAAGAAAATGAAACDGLARRGERRRERARGAAASPRPRRRAACTRPASPLPCDACCHVDLHRRCRRPCGRRRRAPSAILRAVGGRATAGVLASGGAAWRGGCAAPARRPRGLPPARRRRRGAGLDRRASTSPTFTSSPSWCTICASTPACSALTSRSIFSVSSSTRGSPAATASPSLLQPARDARFDDRLAELGNDDA